MKAMKRMMALALAVIMTMAMTVTAFAADEPKGTLTVKVNANNTLEGQTIKLYKLFGLTVNDEGGYAYTVNATYKITLKAVLGMTQTNPTDEDFYNAVAALEGDAVQEFANDFAAAALTAGFKEAATSGKITTAEESHEFTGLDYGYYLVYQTGTKQIQSSLVSVEAETNEVSLKGEAPSIEKTADKATVEIGNVVKYTITGTIPDTTGYTKYTYIIHDTLTDGLDFVADENGTAFDDTNKIVSVRIGEGTPENKEITLTGRTMELDLSQWVRKSQEHKGQTFTVTYYAKVNSGAVVETKNSAKLEYGNDPDNTIETTPEIVVTPTYPLDINKTNKVAAGETAKRLAGATFRLYKNEADAAAANANAIKVSGSAGSYKVDPTSANMDMVTVENEITANCGYNLHLNGLAAGIYWLVETKSPDGYNKLAAPVKVKIEKTGKTEWTVGKVTTEVTDEGTTDVTQVETDKVIDIENSTGSLLPSTGGLSTMILTVISIVLVLGVAVSFIISRRKTA